MRRTMTLAMTLALIGVAGPACKRAPGGSVVGTWVMGGEAEIEGAKREYSRTFNHDLTWAERGELGRTRYVIVGTYTVSGNTVRLVPTSFTLTPKSDETERYVSRMMKPYVLVTAFKGPDEFVDTAAEPDPLTYVRQKAEAQP